MAILSGLDIPDKVDSAALATCPEIPEDSCSVLGLTTFHETFFPRSLISPEVMRLDFIDHK